ncbi:hypothetical protein JCM13591A_09160 [Microbacterium xylanilyticum]
MGSDGIHYATSQDFFRKVLTPCLTDPGTESGAALLPKGRGDFVRTLARSPAEGEEWIVRVMESLGPRLLL